MASSGCTPSKTADLRSTVPPPAQAAWYPIVIRLSPQANLPARLGGELVQATARRPRREESPGSTGQGAR